MRGEWHRYNLKRKVAQLPAISEAQFNEKVAVMNQATQETPKTRASKKEERQRKREELQEKKRQILEIARKAMAEGKPQSEAIANPTEQADQQPTQSGTTQPAELDKPQEQADKEVAAEGPTEEEIISLKLKNKVDIPPTTCLFCKKTRNFDTIDENLEHLWKAHNLYIPERKYLVDVEGLLNYLGEKIGFGFCIACGYQGRTCEAAREHMILKRHMRIPYETEDEKLEISQFYDFSLTYAPRAAAIVNADDVANEDDGDWEDVSDDEDGDASDSNEEDEELLTSDDIIYRHGKSLVLPLGQVLGHRSNQRYYRQNLAPERILTEGQGTVIAAETRHMLTVPERQVLQETKRAWARQKKREDVNDRRAARFVNNQPYYRDELLQ